MDLDRYVAGVMDDFTRTAALADERTQQVSAALAHALEPAIRMALVQSLSDAAGVVTSELNDTRVSVRMDGRNPMIDVQTSTNTDNRPTAPIEDDDQGEITRVTVRLPQVLKHRAEVKAEDMDRSLNSWIVYAIRSALSANTPPTTESKFRRFKGWA